MAETGYSRSPSIAKGALVQLLPDIIGIIPNIIVFQGSFHGRTHQTMAMTTSKYLYRYNYQPLPGADSWCAC